MIYAIDEDLYDTIPLQDIVSAVANPIFIKDEKHRWVFFNSAFLDFTGFIAEEALGKSDYDYFPKEQADVFWAKDNEIFKSGKTSVNQEYLDDVEGTTHVISTKKQLYRGKDGKPYLVCIISDITELVEATQSAEANRQTMANFLASMSHEIRTPMNGILGLLELLNNANTPKSDQPELIKAAFESAKSLQFLLDDILDMTKIQSNQLLIANSSFRLSNLISEIKLFFQTARENKNVVFVSSIDAAVPEYIRTDRLRLKQILINLVSNASKFTECGSIEITIKPGKRDLLNISVLDTGPGISENDIEMIFEPFKQGSQESKASKGGVGLGLAIVKKLSDLLDGSISVRNRSQGGSAFTLQIPLIAGKHDEGSIPDTPKHNQYQMSALVVDDHPTNLMVAKGLLSNLGLDTKAISSAKGILDVCSKQKFDVIFMDIEMPVVDGFEATQTLRNEVNGLNQQTQIVAITGHALTGYREKCLAAGMNDYITKPISLESLQEVLDRINS